MKLYGLAARRRWPLRLLVFGFAVLSLSGWLRLQQSLVSWAWLEGGGLTPGPLSLAVTGAVIGLGGLLPAVGLGLRRSWAPAAARLAAVLYGLWYWADRLLLGQNQYTLTGLPFSLAVTAIALGLVFTLLPLRRKAPAEFEREMSDERR
jgi:hypothetical protein